MQHSCLQGDDALRCCQKGVVQPEEVAMASSVLAAFFFHQRLLPSVQAYANWIEVLIIILCCDSDYSTDC